MVVRKKYSPKEQAEDGKGTNVCSTSGNSGKNSAQESTDDECDGLPKSEVLNRVIGHSFVFSEKNCFCFLFFISSLSLTFSLSLSVSLSPAVFNPLFAFSSYHWNGNKIEKTPSYFIGITRISIDYTKL